MFKKIFAIAAIAASMAMVSCASDSEKLIDKINSASSAKELMEVSTNKDNMEMYKNLTPEEKKKVDEAAEAKKKEYAKEFQEMEKQAADALNGALN